MRRTILFLSRAMLGLWVVLVSAALFLLFSSTPTATNAPFSSVSVKGDSGAVVYLPTRIFRCTEASQQFQCQTNIQSSPLVVTWQTQEDSQGYPTSPSCSALYEGKPVRCRRSRSGGVIGLPDEYEVTGLALSPQQIGAMQQRYWGVRFLRETNEVALLLIGMVTALSGGVIVACFVRLHPGRLSKLFASLCCGLGLYQWSKSKILDISYSMMPPELPPPSADGGAPVAVPYVEGVTDAAFENSLRIAQSSAIAIGVIGVLIVAWVLLRRSYWPVRVIASIAIGIGVFSLSSLSLDAIWLNLAVVPFSTGQGSFLLWQISSAAAAAVAITAIILLWQSTRKAPNRLASLISGIGVAGLVSFSSLWLLLWLGYAD